MQYNMYNCEIIFQGPIVTIRTEWNKPHSTACCSHHCYHLLVCSMDLHTFGLTLDLLDLLWKEAFWTLHFDTRSIPLCCSSRINSTPFWVLPLMSHCTSLWLWISSFSPRKIKKPPILIGSWVYFILLLYLLKAA